MTRTPFKLIAVCALVTVVIGYASCQIMSEHYARLKQAAGQMGHRHAAARASEEDRTAAARQCVYNDHAYSSGARITDTDGSRYYCVVPGVLSLPPRWVLEQYLVPAGQ